MDDAQLDDKPQNIYNVDETGFITDPASEIVVAPKGRSVSVLLYSVQS